MKWLFDLVGASKVIDIYKNKIDFLEKENEELKERIASCKANYNRVQETRREEHKFYREQEKKHDRLELAYKAKCDLANDMEAELEQLRKFKEKIDNRRRVANLKRKERRARQRANGKENR